MTTKAIRLRSVPRLSPSRWCQSPVRLLSCAWLSRPARWLIAAVELSGHNLVQQQQKTHEKTPTPRRNRSGVRSCHAADLGPERDVYLHWRAGWSCRIAPGSTFTIGINVVITTGGNIIISKAFPTGWPSRVPPGGHSLLRSQAATSPEPCSLKRSQWFFHSRWTQLAEIPMAPRPSPIWAKAYRPSSRGYHPEHISSPILHYLSHPTVFRESTP